MQIGDEFVGEYTPEAAEWCNQNRCWMETFQIDEDGTRHFRISRFITEQETPEQVQTRYTQAAQDALDAFARTRGYDGILSACSYATSMDAQFRLEGEYCVELRDQTWRRGYAILAAVLAGTMDLPTVEDFLAMLPVSEAQWPDLPEVYSDEAAE